ncbi:MAG TPA: hypothetical protein VES67_21060 [Vicinamibacterales bacterium]|nr:hypothetical protein [Vicinamibacterales bacterium]
MSDSSKSPRQERQRASAKLRRVRSGAMGVSTHAARIKRAISSGSSPEAASVTSSPNLQASA